MTTLLPLLSIDKMNVSFEPRQLLSISHTYVVRNGVFVMLVSTECCGQQCPTGLAIGGRSICRVNLTCARMSFIASLESSSLFPKIRKSLNIRTCTKNSSVPSTGHGFWFVFNCGRLQIRHKVTIITWRKGSLMPDTSCSGEYPDMIRFFKIDLNVSCTCLRATSSYVDTWLSRNPDGSYCCIFTSCVVNHLIVKTNNSC